MGTVIIMVAMLVAMSMLVATTRAHCVISNPAARHDDDDQLKQYPCGVGLTAVYDGVPTTTLQVGRTEIRWRETISHTGAPYRLAMSFNDDSHYEDYVLLDQIPHNSQGSTSNGGKLHKVYVDIPDVKCDEDAKCSIQLASIMTDKFSGTCAAEDLPESCGNTNYVYFSCGNIIVEGSSDPESLTPFYHSYTGNDKPVGWDDFDSDDWTQDADDGYWYLPANAEDWDFTYQYDVKAAGAASQHGAAFVTLCLCFVALLLL